MSRYKWPKYVPVGKRRQKASREIDVLRDAGIGVQPVEIDGRKIARTFWAMKWCEHLESFSDYANRLPRGRTYVRNGSVLHMQISKGEIRAMVSGTSIYHVRIGITELPAPKWAAVKESCSGKIGSLLELLQGNFSTEVMSVVTHKRDGLFPSPAEISLDCSCPDWAKMCKHVAAVLYGVGTRLDTRPELLFLLRGVKHEELLQTNTAALTAQTSGRKRVAASELSNLFGIDIIATEPTEPKKPEKQAPPAPTPTKISKSAPPQKEQRPPTARSIRTLRRRLGMQVIEFADHLGVSTATVVKWERSKGALKLQARTLEALRRAESE
ncbi:MAG: SWIM zinc finger family protein [Cyanobacteria bacterium SZAS LIN-3]|nr:SWIM zinc finger family protein [Cyanobacteria bacterium SZAS LIN-3]